MFACKFVIKIRVRLASTFVLGYSFISRTLANHKKDKQHSEPIKTPSNYM